MAVVSTSGTPVVSKAYSTPRPPVASRIASTGSTSVGETRWVAPNSSASFNREARRLTATIVVAPASRAAITAHSPTEPAPKTATDEPGPTRRTSRTVPAPVCTPQASGPAIRRSTSSGSVTTLRPSTTANVLNDDCPKKWSPTGRPSASVVAVDPSGRRQANFSVAIVSQYAVRPARQRGHLPQEGKLRTTESPGTTP